MSAVTTIAKPAANVAAKPASKAKPKAAAKVAQTPVAIKYAVADFARPSAGNALAAHTAAFLTLSGISDRPVARAQCVKVIGARAVQYHVGNGNFQPTASGLALTDKGAEFFASRAVDPELFAAYSEVFTTGKVNDVANVKTPSSVVKL
jgi:hypothetical protein